MSINPSYDSMGKSLIKLEPKAVLQWLTKMPADEFEFHGWADPTYQNPTGEHDLASDLVADIELLKEIGPPWVWGVELQATAEADMDLRVDEYRIKIKRFYRRGLNRGDRPSVGAILVNFRGKSVPMPPDTCAGANMHHDFTFPIINLEELNADTVLQEIAVGTAPLAILGWIPLMKGGNTPSIIQKWLDIANAIPDDNYVKRELASMVKVFADAVDQGEAWREPLKGWNIMTSKIMAGWVDEGRVEGRVEGSVATWQSAINRLAVRVFGQSPTHIAQIAKITDLERLTRIHDAILDVKSWDELLTIK